VETSEHDVVPSPAVVTYLVSAIVTVMAVVKLFGLQ
jgi:hypothetical protein